MKRWKADVHNEDAEGGNFKGHTSNTTPLEVEKIILPSQ